MINPMSPDLETRAAALKRAAEAQPGIAAEYLFGSAAAGRATPISDLDVAVDAALPEPARARVREGG